MNRLERERIKFSEFLVSDRPRLILYLSLLLSCLLYTSDAADE